MPLCMPFLLVFTQMVSSLSTANMDNATTKVKNKYPKKEEKKNNEKKKI